jgi:hypothetical protein
MMISLTCSITEEGNLEAAVAVRRLKASCRTSFRHVNVVERLKFKEGLHVDDGNWHIVSRLNPIQRTELVV